MADKPVTSDEVPVYNPPADFSAKAYVKSLDEYRALYERSVSDPEAFWAEQAEQRITWYEKWHTVRQVDYHKAEIAWYLGGKLNVCYNCVDRHVEAGRGDDTALIWEGNDPADSKAYTFSELHVEVQRAANALKNLGIGKGRPRLHLHADDSRAGHRDAGLRTHRGDSLDRLWRLHGRQPRDADQRLGLQKRSSRRTPVSAARSSTSR